MNDTYTTKTATGKRKRISDHNDLQSRALSNVMVETLAIPQTTILTTSPPHQPKRKSSSNSTSRKISNRGLSRPPYYHLSNLWTYPALPIPRSHRRPSTTRSSAPTSSIDVRSGGCDGDDGPERAALGEADYRARVGTRRWTHSSACWSSWPRMSVRVVAERADIFLGAQPRW